MMEEVAQALAGHGQRERFTGDREPNRGPGCRTDAILLQLPTSVVRPAPTAQIGRSPAAEPYDLQRDPAPSAKSLDRGAN